MNLFENKGAAFSDCRKYRYALWRIWDESKPVVMFIGLNPSKADENENDNTIKRVRRIANHNGYGGFYMLNCFPFISTNPAELKDCANLQVNDEWLANVASKCQDVVFAWGNFKIIRTYNRDNYLKGLFPNAKALYINNNGSPKHPLFCRATTELINFSK